MPREVIRARPQSWCNQLGNHSSLLPLFLQTAYGVGGAPAARLVAELKQGHAPTRLPQMVGRNAMVRPPNHVLRVKRAQCGAVSCQTGLELIPPSTRKDAPVTSIAGPQCFLTGNRSTESLTTGLALLATSIRLTHFQAEESNSTDITTQIARLPATTARSNEFHR